MIVVDDGGQTPLLEIIGRRRDRLDVRLVVRPNGGVASARNQGLAEAGGEVVAFLDDDCEPRPGWLEELVRAVWSAPHVLAAGSTVNALPENPFSETSQRMIDSFAAWHRSEKGPGFFSGSQLAARRADLVAVGGFCEGYGLSAGEDRDLCRRWTGRGWPLVAAEGAVVEHRHALSLGGFLGQHRNYGRAALRFRETGARRLGLMRTLGEMVTLQAHMIRYPTERGGRRALLRLLTIVAQSANSFGFAEAVFSRLASTERGAVRLAPRRQKGAV